MGLRCGSEAQGVPRLVRAGGAGGPVTARGARENAARKEQEREKGEEEEERVRERGSSPPWRSRRERKRRKGRRKKQPGQIRGTVKRCMWRGISEVPLGEASSSQINPGRKGGSGYLEVER